MDMNHIQREGDLTLSTAARIYGSTPLFNLEADDALMSLSFAGQNQLLDWINWTPTNEYKLQKYFIDYVRAADDGSGEPTVGYITDPCADGNGVEWGKTDFVLTDFARLRRISPVRDATKIGMKYAAVQPRYRLDGEVISNDYEYEVRITTEVLMQDLRRMLVVGNKTTSGMFDGLERLIKTGYTDSNGAHASSMDSVVIDWNGNTMAGGAGVTWNGVGVGSGYNFVSVLLSAFRRVMDRIRMSPSLSAAPIQVGDIVFAAPTHINRALLDQYTGWSVAPGVAYNEVNLNTYEARTFRNNLNGGMFGAGRIFLDGFEIPLINYDWGLIKGPTRGDAYLLTGRAGGIKILEGQFLDMKAVPPVYPGRNFRVQDNGLLLSWEVFDNTCVRYNVEMQPRLYCMAPWAQVRFMDIKATQPGGVLSPDPWETSFYPESSFDAVKV